MSGGLLVAPSPVLYDIAGTIGSGKSSFTRDTDQILQVPILDPDQVARAIDPEAPVRVAVEAGRRVLQLCHTYLAAGQSFAIETTLAGNAQLRLMNTAKEAGTK